ncbi:hypothetical protein K438DRAFT_1996871 [Mycena galopus ATCC 62051]|nr:hypothetical protein K438DRAFT_1996871 [Mycena galopus ATCC 62051]
MPIITPQNLSKNQPLRERALQELVQVRLGAHAGEEDSDLLHFRIVVFVLSFPFLSSSAGGVLGHSGCRGRAVPDARRRPVLRQ